jgi:uncharacterized membrane protein HdeD (DUF308 family)
MNKSAPKSTRAMQKQPKVNVVNSAAKFQRTLLGFSAAVLLIAGLAMDIVPGLKSNSTTYFSGSLLKVGVVLGVAWLAAPQLEKFGWHRIRGTLLVAIIVVLVLWAIRPRVGAWAGAILLGSGAFFALVGWFRGLVDKNRQH